MTLPGFSKREPWLTCLNCPDTDINWLAKAQINDFYTNKILDGIKSFKTTPTNPNPTTLEDIQIIGIIWMVGGLRDDLAIPNYSEYVGKFIDLLRGGLNAAANKSYGITNLKPMTNNVSYLNTPVIIQKVPVSSVYTPEYNGSTDYKKLVGLSRTQHDIVSAKPNVVTMELSGDMNGGTAYLASNDYVHASSYTITKFGVRCAEILRNYFLSRNNNLLDNTAWANITSMLRSSNTDEDEQALNNETNSSSEELNESIIYPNEELDGLTIYPNPASNMLSLQDNFKEEAEIKIVDFQGRVVKKINPNTLSEKQALTIDVSDLNSGIYLVYKYVNGKLVKTSKISKE